MPLLPSPNSSDGAPSDATEDAVGRFEVENQPRVPADRGCSPIEMETTLRRQLFATAIAFFSCVTVFADDTFTSPQTIVNVALAPTSNGDELIFTGAQIYFETVPSSDHVESQRDRPDLANRTQDVNILQSRLLRFGVRQLKFRTITGDELGIFRGPTHPPESEALECRNTAA